MVALAITMVAGAGCASGPRPVADETADPVEWLRRNGHPLDPGAEGFADLEALRPLFDGKRIVQLGENTHGTAEYTRLKARLVRFLHQELGFDVLALESALYQCDDASRSAAEAPAATTLRRCAFGVWHSSEMLPLFEYLRSTRHGTHPLRLAGIDVQPIGSNKAGRPRFLSSAVAAIDSAYAQRVFALDSAFLAVYARGPRVRRSFFRQDAGRAMAAAYDSLAAFLRNGTTDHALVARQTARSMAWYIRQQSAPTTREYVEHRDEGMAENLTFLARELYRGRRIVVWGHNYHVRHDNLSIPPDTSMFPNVAARTMGSWVRERFADSVYTIGIYAYRGRAADNGGDIYEIAPADDGSLEALLHEVGAAALFVDLSSAASTPETNWMRRPISARYDGTTPLMLVPHEQYDGILFVDVVTPRQPLAPPM